MEAGKEYGKEGLQGRGHERRKGRGQTRRQGRSLEQGKE